MIRLELPIVVACVVSAVLLAFLWGWYRDFGALRKRSNHRTGKVEQCVYCAHVFVVQTNDRIIKCPMCESYLEASYANQQA